MRKQNFLLNNSIQLSKHEEEGTPDAEVTREDQDKINAFSRLHQREKVLEEELQTKQVCDMGLLIEQRLLDSIISPL